jgi:hypothetical protein
MGHLFRSYEDRTITLEKGRGRRFLYNLPIILQSLIFITLIFLLLFTKNVKLSKYVENSHIEKWGWLLSLPILFQVMMSFVPSIVQKRWRGGWFLTIAVLSTLFLISMHFPITYLLTPHRSAYTVSKAIPALLPPDQELYEYGISLYGVDFYDKIRTPLVDRYGELKPGMNQLPADERFHYFLSQEELIKRCEEKGSLYCLTRYKENVEELKKRISVLEVLWDDGVYYLLRLKYQPCIEAGRASSGD